MYMKLFLFNLVVKYCIPQVLSGLLPRETVTEDEITDRFLTASVLRSQSKIFSAVKTAVNVPKAFESVSQQIEFPYYNNTVNNGRILDKFLIDYEIGDKNEDASLNFTMLVRKYGYDVESYEVITEDGYKLSILRITGVGTPVFLMHGLLGSADDFIVAGPDSGLAYLLVEKGYDVWLGNARGSKYSRRHINLSPNESAFWDFSWHEIGIYDLPAMIDYVLHQTNQSSLKYIGFSQGTTTFFVMASEKPEYNKKISIMIALAPVAFMKYVRSPIVRMLASGTKLLEGLSLTLGLHEFFPDSNFIRIVKRIVCGAGIVTEIICSNIIFLVSGFDFEQLNVTNLPVIFGHFPCGASRKQLLHFSQSVTSKDFRHLDLGSAKNLEKYGSTVSPSYPLYQVDTPVYLFFGNTDWLAHPNDVAQLNNKLKNVVDVYKVPFDKFAHLDFIMAKDVKTLVYNRVINTLESVK